MYTVQFWSKRDRILDTWHSSGLWCDSLHKTTENETSDAFSNFQFLFFFARFPRLPRFYKPYFSPALAGQRLITRFGHRQPPAHTLGLRLFIYKLIDGFLMNLAHFSSAFSYIIIYLLCVLFFTTVLLKSDRN